MDIETDLKAEIVRIFNNHGIRYSKEKPLSDMLLDHLTYRRKYVEVKPRKIVVSNEIRASVANCSKVTEFLMFLDDCANGADLNPYQTNTLKQVRFHDFLLYNWHIHHFHLSSELDAKNGYFRKRSDFLVFAHIRPDIAYFLDFDRHREGVFANERWLEIMQSNWPWLLKEYKNSAFEDIRPNLTPVDRQILWNKGYTIGMTKVRDAVYVDPGLGITTSGHSLLVVQQSHRVLRWMYEIEKLYRENKNGLYTEINRQYGVPIELISLRARFSPNNLEVFEETSGAVIFTYT